MQVFFAWVAAQKLSSCRQRIRGPWRESNIKSTTKPIEEAFTITDPNTGNEYTNTWAFSRESLDRMIRENRIIWKDTLPKQKEFMYEMTNETQL